MDDAIEVGRGALDDSMVRSLAFSPDGSLLAAGAGNGLVRLWETASGPPAALGPVPAQP